jgi:hypothetical protein
MKDTEILLLLGGAFALWYVMTQTPAAQAAQQSALAQTAALQSQSIAANQNVSNVNTGANLISQLATDFS